ncbi:MAG: hypothetical protein QFE16_09020 [Pseudomonadota bacterium]|jgi:uncharacterized membrane protein|nr:hypothetical protein [Pseudomonadota bacterium]
MNESVQFDEVISDEHPDLTTLTHVMYALHTASWFSAGVFSVIAMIINTIKRPDLPNDFFRSHFRWQARSFWFTLLWLVLALPLWILVIPGWIAYSGIGLWYLYRFIRGWWCLAERRPMPLPAP